MLYITIYILNIRSRKDAQTKITLIKGPYCILQCVNIPTRKQNILDLCFSNDTNFISNIEVIDNVIMSDHSSIIMETDIEALYGYSNQKEHTNIYYTDIHEYDTMGATVTEIGNIRKYLREIN